MSDGVRREFFAAFRNRGFVIVFSVMLIAALGLNAAVRAMDMHFRKERVELRRDLDMLPSRLGPWVKMLDQRLPMEVEHTLGTKSYISRTYLDSRRVEPAEMAKIEAATGVERDRLVNAVAHVPERCMVGGGFNPENPAVVTLPVFKDVPNRSPGLNVKYVEFRDKARPSIPKRNVAYAFQVNGVYEHDSIQGVRLRLQNIFEKYGYYAKIELATFLGDDTAKAQATMTDFLSFTMPDLEKCLPDWHEVTGEDAPLNAGQ